MYGAGAVLPVVVQIPPLKNLKPLKSGKKITVYERTDCKKIPLMRV